MSSPHPALRILRNWESLRMRKDFKKQAPLLDIQKMYKTSGDMAHKIRNNHQYEYSGKDNKKKLVHAFWKSRIVYGGFVIPHKSGASDIERAANSKSHRVIAIALHRAYSKGIRARDI